MTAGVLCTAVPSRAGFDRRYSPAAQLLLGQARHQRIGLVESVELLDDLPGEAPKMPGRDENTRRRAEYHQVLLAFEQPAEPEHFRRLPSGPHHQRRKGNLSGLRRQQAQPRLRVALFQDLERLAHLRVAEPVLRGLAVEDHPAADRGDRRKLPDDEPVAGQIQTRLLEARLGERAAAGLQFLRFEEDHLGHGLLRPAVEMDLGVVLQGTRGIEQRDRAVEARRRLEEARLGKRHAARDFTGLDTGQVQSSPLPCQGDVSGLVVDFNPAYAYAAPERMDFYLRFLLDSAGDQRSGYHRAKSLHHEGAIDGQTEGQVRGLCRDLRAQPPQLTLQRVKTLAGARAHSHYRRAFEKRPGHKLLRFEFHQVNDFRLYQVGFRDHHQTFSDAKQFADVKV